MNRNSKTQLPENSDTPPHRQVASRDALGLPPLGQRRAETPAERSAREARIAEARRQADERKAQFEREDAEQAAATLEWIRERLHGDAYAARGTVVEDYLQKRGIKVVPEILGYVPAYGPDRIPAMLAPFGIATENEPGVYEIEPEAITGAHITLLTHDGRKATDREGRTKITLGRWNDAPIMLVPPNDGLGLVVTEGIEEALRAHQKSGLGAWAAGAAGRLPGLAKYVPSYIEVVTLIEDDNKAGRDGCGKLAHALSRRGIEVRIERGGEEGRDAP